MSGFGRVDGRNRIGLIDMEVSAAYRRKGYGRHLVNEILKFARGQSMHAVDLQTRSTNTAALALYRSLGFEPVETATLYRKPGFNLTLFLKRWAWSLLPFTFAKRHGGIVLLIK